MVVILRLRKWRCRSRFIEESDFFAGDRRAVQQSGVLTFGVGWRRRCAKGRQGRRVQIVGVQHHDSVAYNCICVRGDWSDV